MGGEMSTPKDRRQTITIGETNERLEVFINILFISRHF